MTKGDIYHNQILVNILQNGYKDENPRPHYEDKVNQEDIDSGKIILQENQWISQNAKGEPVICTPAHTYSINHAVTQYDLSKGECPALTLRPIAWKSAVKEIFWIYQMQSNKLSDLQKMGVKYWDDWDIGDGTIGCRYGETVRKHHLMDKLLDGLINNPFGRRHIMSLWQEDDFDDATGGTTRGLAPCCYETIWNVRRGKDGNLYLDMTMNQRSSDFATSVAVNELQYAALLMMIAKHCGYEPGVFTHVMENVQIYDRHLGNARTLIERTPVDGEVRLVFDTTETDFYRFKPEDFNLEGYPREKIKEINPQLDFELGI